MTRFDRTPGKTSRARRLRRDATLVERKLWSKLRGAQIQGASFRRQHPIGPFVVDFYSSVLQLAIELDGGQHAFRRSHDEARDRYLRQKGIRVVRYWNTDVVENLSGVLEHLGQEIERRRIERTPTRSAARSDLPLSGGGSP